MRIISKTRLREFWVKEKQAETSMREWIKLVRQANWRNFSDIRQTFNHVDIYKNCTIFDAGGNKYRIIAKIEYQKHIVFIRYVLTHSKYNTKKWQSDCN